MSKLELDLWAEYTKYAHYITLPTGRLNYLYLYLDFMEII